MTICFLVEIFTPTSASITPTPTPSWIKKKLEALKNLLAKLTEKAGAALPGIIGSIVSWILCCRFHRQGDLDSHRWNHTLSQQLYQKVNDNHLCSHHVYSFFYRNTN